MSKCQYLLVWINHCAKREVKQNKEMDEWRVGENNCCLFCVSGVSHQMCLIKCYLWLVMLENDRVREQLFKIIANSFIGSEKGEKHKRTDEHLSHTQNPTQWLATEANRSKVCVCRQWRGCVQSNVLLFCQFLYKMLFKKSGWFMPSTSSFMVLWTWLRCMQGCAVLQSEKWCRGFSALTLAYKVKHIAASSLFMLLIGAVLPLVTQWSSFKKKGYC